MAYTNYPIKPITLTQDSSRRIAVTMDTVSGAAISKDAPVSLALSNYTLSWTPKMRQVDKVEPCP
jgi:hypothetical protein